MQAMKELSAKDVAQADLGQAIIVDVRTQAEFAAQRLGVPTALAPVDELQPEDFALRHGIIKDTPIYTLCNSGNRSKRAAEKFLAAGFTTVFSIAGGLSAWEAAGLPMVSKNPVASFEGVISMERQVRILAGSVSFIFALLGLLVHPIFLSVVLVVGAGLVFSGITNWCGMALLLAKAPWNKSLSCTGASCSTGGKAKASPGSSCQ